MKKFPFSIIVFVISSSLQAQETGYNPGAIITRNNERTEGLVKNVNLVPARILDNVKFKIAEDEKVTSYSPTELAAYESDGHLFVSKKSASGVEMFVRKFNNGKLQLYGAMTFDGTAAYNVTYVPYIQLEGDPVIHRVEQLGFKKQMLTYLKDAPSVCKEIADKTLRWEDITIIVKQYNEEVAGE